MDHDSDNLPETKTTFDIHQDSLTVQYTDPFVTKGQTTFDIAVKELTKEHPPVPVGTLQIHGGAIYRFDGTWVLVQ